MPKQYTCEKRGCRWVGPNKKLYLRHKARFHAQMTQETPEVAPDDIQDTVMQDVDTPPTIACKYI